MPASVAVASGSATATFTATAGTITTNQTATITAALNGSMQTATISLVAPVDTTPPVRSNASPSGIQATGTTQVTLGLTTDEIATCRYATTTGVAYSAMASTFATTGGTTHTTLVTGLVNGGSYNYYVRCQDRAGNPDTTDFPISFTVAQPTTPPTFVQVNQNQIASGTSTAVTFRSATVAGNTVVVYVIWSNTGNVTVTDSRANTFVSAGSPVSWGSGYRAQVFYAAVATGGADTVTATYQTSVTSFGVVYVHEYAGISATNPVDAAVSGSGSSGTLNSGTDVTTSANDLIFGAGVSDNVVTAAGSGFTTRDLSYGNITEDRIASTAGSYAATATHDGKLWGMQVVAFRAAH